jgi:transposase InsO family protein
MPWKETTKMDERRKFIHTVLESPKTFKDICSDFHISTKTGYKWFHRFKEEGYSGLEDHSKRPLSHPARLPEEVVCDLIAIKLAHRHFGPKKVRELYQRIHRRNIPSLSSVNRVLKRAGLVTPRKKRRTPSGRLTSQIDITQPNDLWTIDFKGWWTAVNHGIVEPLTVRDAFSRFVLAAQHVEKRNTETVKAVFDRLFKTYGLPEAIQSDNGSPFASANSLLGISRLTAWFLSLGIQIHRSRPGHPQDNGGHERMHRDLKERVQVRFRGKVKQYQAELDLWREEFNGIRPHEALGMKTPQEVYTPSHRKYTGDIPEIDYPTVYEVRRVNRKGCIRYRRQPFFITTSLSEYPVGLKTIDSLQLAVYFARVRLGIIDLKTLSFSPERTL